jgi:putative ABC transport system permease protein
VWGVSALKSIAPYGTPRIAEVGVDGRVLAFAAVLSLATGILFGLVPAIQAARDRFTPALKQGGRGQMGDGGGRTRRVLIVAELALALILLVGGGLLLRTFVALQRADLGFNPDNVLAGFVAPPLVTGPPKQRIAARIAFYDAVLARASALPGVRHAALSSVVPLGGDGDTNFLIEGQPVPTRSADALIVWYRIVSANYFAAMEIPLRRGRLFAEREPSPSLVINETMAKKHWPTEEALGRRIRFEEDGPWFTVVGIVADVRVRGARETNVVEAYVPYWHMAEPGVNIVLKTATDPAALAEPLRRAVKDVDPAIAVASIVTMDRLLADSIASSRFFALLVAIFATLAVVLAAVGLYGVLSYAVAQRTPEIGVRLALGAAEPQIFGRVVGESLKLSAIGLVLGAAGSVAVGQALRRMLFGVGETDVLTFVVTATILVGVVFLASYVPARRAMRVDPMEALRVE